MQLCSRRFDINTYFMHWMTGQHHPVIGVAVVDMGIGRVQISLGYGF